MSRTATVEAFFGEKNCLFKLGIGEAQRIEEIRGEALRKVGFGPGHAGLMALQQRLSEGQFLLADIREPLRLGLMGGGMEREDAAALVDRHLEPGYVVRCAELAGKIVSAFLIGVDDEAADGARPGEPDGPPAPTQPGFPTDVSAGDGSTDRAASSD